MIKTLEERLQRAHTEYIDKVNNERELELILESLPITREQISSVSIGRKWVAFFLYPTSLEETEMEILPLIRTWAGKREKRTPASWSRTVTESGVYHSLESYKDKTHVSFWVGTQNEFIGPGCEIIPVPTGKKVKVNRLVEEDEIEYLLRCSE